MLNYNKGMSFFPVKLTDVAIKSILLLLSSAPMSLAELSGNLSLQHRYFTEDPVLQNSKQHNQYTSISTEPEFFIDWNDGNQIFTFKPFYRLDQYDENRTHGDIRELFWQQVFEDWELKVGISKVFWGVTESQHLVDIINQTDNVENIDGEDKLGQPMISASLERNWGMVDIFILPYFRERNFPGTEGRPGLFPVVDENSAIYESSDESHHLDYATRVFNYISNWELGLSLFKGTSREPSFVYDAANNVLRPFYRQMTQLGLDAQMTTEDWLLKLEAIKRNWSAEDYVAFTTGFEYTLVGINNSPADLGIVVEYMHDSRGDNSTSIFQNDIMTGFRYTLNDVHSTEALLGFISDTSSRELIISLEASRRLSQHVKLTLEATGFNNIDNNSQAYPLRKDDFIQLEIAYYF